MGYVAQGESCPRIGASGAGGQPFVLIVTPMILDTGKEN